MFSLPAQIWFLAHLDYIQIFDSLNENCQTFVGGLKCDYDQICIDAVCLVSLDA